jgi:hypothetical protein
MDCRVKPGNDEKGKRLALASEVPWEEMDDRQSSVEPHHGPNEAFGILRKQHEE